MRCLSICRQSERRLAPEHFTHLHWSSKLSALIPSTIFTSSFIFPHIGRIPVPRERLLQVRDASAPPYPLFLTDETDTVMISSSHIRLDSPLDLVTVDNTDSPYESTSIVSMPEETEHGMTTAVMLLVANLIHTGKRRGYY